MFYSYRKFNKPSHKGIYLLIILVTIFIVWGLVSYKGVNIDTKQVTRDLIIPTNK